MTEAQKIKDAVCEEFDRLFGDLKAQRAGSDSAGFAHSIMVLAVENIFNSEGFNPSLQKAFRHQILDKEAKKGRK